MPASNSSEKRSKAAGLRSDDGKGPTKTTTTAGAALHSYSKDKNDPMPGYHQPDAVVKLRHREKAELINNIISNIDDLILAHDDGVATTQALAKGTCYPQRLCSCAYDAECPDATKTAYESPCTCVAARATM
ncbi:hypothetical protein Cob_v003677 [Colletotrichum orbiculare MAFF 240422]|uniref:Uncharacterized protein n=1 Tax=Colletotrichum orbiculare (strain 104-T / ATCC 96160 / CBS 514.97 / LARS 414 / MAFF 240422) TaxID=1213857 RepID=A0A484FYU1_COLOR|nr:hypothetical protein Cob_v003677 [Colletotrichum orbiculare MAFF 240422]